MGAIRLSGDKGSLLLGCDFVSLSLIFSFDVDLMWFVMLFRLLFDPLSYCAVTIQPMDGGARRGWIGMRVFGEGVVCVWGGGGLGEEM